MGNDIAKHLGTLSRRGPEEVLIGDLGYAGIPGKVYTPAELKGGPGVVFAHDWFKGIKNYHRTLLHLASWGIVVIAPDTEKSTFPNHRGFSADIESCLQILTGVRLGEGKITVSPGKVGIVGHGLGAGAGILAAARRENVAAVAALYPSETNPSNYLAAESVQCPGLVLGTGDIPFFDYGNAAQVALNWGGECAYKELDKAGHNTLSEDVFLKLATGIGSWRFGVREQLRGIVTGFLLHQLDGKKEYADFSDPQAETKKLKAYWGEKLEQRADSSDRSRLDLGALRR